MAKISVVVNTRNEEDNLPRLLKSVKAIADEIVVVDMESTDRTVEIAKKAKAKVYSHRPTGIVEPARNFALSKATGDWILLLDADEEITPQLAHKLKELVEGNSKDFYRLPRKNIIFGKWMQHSRWWPDYIIRFFKRGKVEWSEIIHSVPTTTGKGLDIEDKEEFAIIHHNYSTVSDYLNRLNTYTTKQAEILQEKGYVFSWKDMVSKPVGEFLSRYFAGSGYKDGIHGLALCILQGFSEFIVYLRVWETSKFRDEGVKLKESIEMMKKMEKEVSYWQADALTKEHGGFVNKVKRKFKLR